MPTFEYIALDIKGESKKGTVIAETPAAARQLLKRKKLHPTQLQSISDAVKSNNVSLGKIFSGKRKRELLDFTRQLATMIKANVQLTEALTVLIQQSKDSEFSQVIQSINDQVLAGEGLAESLKQYPKWFDPIYISMIRVGEATGNMSKSTELLSNYLSKGQKLEAKVKSAMMYPMILVGFCFIVVAILMTVVVPKLTEIIEKSGKEMPLPTEILKWLSESMVSYWHLIILAICASWFLFKRFMSTPSGRLKFDAKILTVPIFGDMLRQAVVARFASTLAALIRSGMPVAEALKVVSEVTGNAVMTNAINEARERIMAGADIATPLRESKVVDVAVAHMISVGERTGELEGMLLSISESIEEGTDIRIQRMSALIEPVIIALMAIVVGFILMATVLPIMEVSDI
jgi:type II secretory pathway component PulF